MQESKTKTNKKQARSDMYQQYYKLPKKFLEGQTVLVEY